MTAPFSHRDRVVVVTGGGTGIGRAIAEAFLRQGARVLICGRRPEVLERAVAEMRAIADGAADSSPDRGHGEDPGVEAPENPDRAESDAVQYFVADMTIAAQVEALADEALRLWGGLDVWINNAGSMERGVLPEADGDHLQRVLDANVRSAFLGCRAAVARFQGQERGQGRGRGVIVNVASYLAEHAGASATVPAYTAAKGAVVALTRSLAVRHGPEGIRVNAVCPALIPTELNASIWEQAADPKALSQELGERYPLRRIGRPEDAAWAAVYLASDEAAWVTGHALYVDGGMSAV